jgi:DNA-binding protein HU-beta
MQSRYLGDRRRSRLPAGDGPGAFSRPGVVSDAGEPAAQLDCGRQLAVLFEDSTDRSGIGFGDNKHDRQIGASAAPGNQARWLLSEEALHKAINYSETLQELMLTIRPILDCAREVLAVVVRIGVLRAGYRSESLSQEIVMPPAKKPAPAAKKTAAPTKVVAKQAAPVVKKAAAPPSKAAAPAKKAAASAKKAVPAKAAPPITITLKHIATELAEGHDLSKKATEAVLGDFVALVTRQLVKGDKIRLVGLGILQVRDRPARTARNPATGESIEVAASKKIAFRPAKELKDAV